MSLELLPVEEADLEAVAHLVYEAFSDSMMDILYPNGYTQDDIAHNVTTNRAKLKSQSDILKINKVIDTTLPTDDAYRQIISVAIWKFHTHARSKAELEREGKDDEVYGLPPSANAPVFDAFHGEMERGRTAYWGGRPYILLSVLATRPGHHRRGAGAIQLSWGMQRADTLGLPCWLESTPNGKALYERFGFEGVGLVDFDPIAWGRTEGFVTTNMLRATKEREE